MWSEPKTNWTADDYINVEDFNRIRNNLEYLQEKAKELYPDDFMFITGEKTYSDIPYADVWNNLEYVLEDLKDSTFELDVGNMIVFRPYMNYIDYNELNRLESACVRYKELFERQHLTIEHLSFTLGNYGGVKI